MTVTIVVTLKDSIPSPVPDRVGVTVEVGVAVATVTVSVGIGRTGGVSPLGRIGTTPDLCRPYIKPTTTTEHNRKTKIALRSDAWSGETPLVPDGVLLFAVPDGPVEAVPIGLDWDNL